ncbi:MAG: DNA mismatch repair protein MutS, partial [Thioalkalivibrio sp.]|nr:DNA mismatch repair protein MutS [Thioalkalivibrio sp.]
LTDRVREHGEELQRMLGVLTWIDLAFAAGRMSQQMNAHAPALLDETRMHLVDGYHPLLLLQYAEGNGPRPVPLSLELAPGRPLLLITGPNTGGKTVALKTVGLLVTMAWCGLHIPAEGDCSVGAFDRVMVDVGDHQSLLHHLSTFAGHVEVLKRVLEHAGGESLILLDELGTGTDPDEGAALAMAVLDELRSRGVFGIVNTHLAPLKDYAGRHPGILNASMQFDSERLVPTYRLLPGEPGISFGLTIAEKNGLPAALVARAREHLAELPSARASR